MIPREIDELMWTIAEGNDSSAIEEFGNRYPNLREEMLKRMRTINALKSGNRLPRSTQVPTFQNAKVKPTDWRWAGASFAIAVLALSAFSIWKSIPKVEPPVKVLPVNTEAAQLPDNTILYNNNQDQPINATPRQGVPSTSRPRQNSTNSTLPKPEKLKSMQIESATLQAAILLIANEDHMSVSFAPGMPNPTIKVNFQNMAPLDMLKELGQQYAFTTVLDGDHAIIIIPKKDEDESQIISGNH